MPKRSPDHLPAFWEKFDAEYLRKALNQLDTVRKDEYIREKAQESFTNWASPQSRHQDAKTRAYQKSEMDKWGHLYKERQFPGDRMIEEGQASFRECVSSILARGSLAHSWNNVRKTTGAIGFVFELAGRYARSREFKNFAMREMHDIQKITDSRFHAASIQEILSDTQVTLRILAGTRSF